MKRKPKRIRKVAIGVGVSSKPRRRNNLPPALPQYGATRPRGDLVTFAIPPKADIRQCDLLVRLVPNLDVSA
jgi:hypothetical protein